MSKWKRRLLWLGAIVISLIVYAWFFGIQTLLALEAWNIGRKMPIAKSVPIDLEDLSISQAPAERISFRRFELEIPRRDLDEDKTRVVGTWAIVHFHSGITFILCASPPNGFIMGMAKDKNTSVFPELLAKLYGKDVLLSDYAFKKAIYDTVPSQITLHSSSNRAIGLSMILTIKAVMPPTTDYAIYNIQSNEFKGFQLGSPSRHPKKMSMELFAEDREIEINIDQEGPNPDLTQAEINRIIQSAHKTANTEATFTANPV
jgi:hypothetical protein